MMWLVSNRVTRLLCLLILLPVVGFAQTIGPRIPPGLDGRFLDLTRQVPGFGGYFFDENGDLNVYLTDLSRESAARVVVAEVARNRPERAHQPWRRPAEIVVRRGDFDYQQLNDWRGRLSAALAIAGVQLLDTDEATNRIFIGVTEEDAKARVLSRVAALGVPRNAVVVDIVASASPITSLRECDRPLVGGLEINFLIDGVQSQCTLGVNVWYSNVADGVPVGTPGFYTASHCSSVRGGTDGTVFSQGGARIGYEMWDPPFFTNAYDYRCPVNVQCRWSDVAFAAYDAGVDRHQGALAQTLYRGFGPWQSGSLDINSATPEFILYYTAPLPVVGMYLDKVGRTTGWTTGAVSRTCVDYFIGGADVLCQDQVEAYADSGDSGSPVFQWISQTTAAFSGIVWARTGTGAFVFSNLDRIAADMGSGVTYGPN